MSRYCEVKTQFKDQESLILALMETGKWSREQIEVHEIPENMRRWGRDKVAKANLIIRKKDVGTGAFNDVGFIKNEDGQYQAIISDIDRRKHNDTWIDKLTANYAFRVVERQQKNLGRSVARTRLPNGHQTVEVTGYR